MSDERPPDEEDGLLRFIASTVESTRDRVNTLYESVATRDELRTQTAAIRGDIEQVQLRLLLSKELPHILRLPGQ